MPHRIVILGGGISGLSCAWFLKKKWGSAISLTILEKGPCLGGWIQTSEREGFLFEQGPRSCRPGGTGVHTLHLIEELGLQDQVIVGNPSARIRYLYSQQKLQKVPTNLFSVLISPLMKGLLPALWHDFRTPKGKEKDESIYDFVSRRLSSQLADRLLDPLVSGIYAGDIHKLSIQSCFPFLYRLEQEHGSLIKGLLKSKKPSISLSPFAQKLQKEPVISFKKGMITFIQALACQVESEIYLNSAVTDLDFHPEGIVVSLANKKSIEADTVISALPALALGNLLKSKNFILGSLLDKIPHATVAVVNVGYRKSVLTKQGFGYLVPSQEKEKILGCVWDSIVFPQQNQDPQETRLTVMIGGTHYPMIETLTSSECQRIALNAIAKQLGIQAAPDVMLVTLAKQAIPQYEVGHQELVQNIRTLASSLSPHLQLIGNTFNGVSINDCILTAAF